MTNQQNEAPAWERLRKRGAFGSVLLLFTIYILIILFHQEPPSLTDYSDWTYQGVLLSNHLKHIPDPFHTLKNYPVPNSISTVGIAVLNIFVPWQMASKLWIVLMLVTFLAVSSYVTQVHSVSPAVWWICPAIFLNLNLWYGFANFQIGLCWTILIAALLIKGERREWLFGVLLTLAFFSHMIPFVVAAILLIIYARQSRRYSMLWQLLPGALLSVCYLWGRFVLAHDADGSSGMVDAVRNYSALFWAFKVNSYIKSLGFINPGSVSGSAGFTLLGPSTFIVLLTVNLILGGALLVCLVSAAQRAYREKRDERFVWTTALIVTPFYLVAPATMFGISDPGARLLQACLAVTIFLISTPKPWQAALMWLAAGCEFILQSCAIFLFATIPYNKVKETHSATHLPQAALILGHVPNHVEDYFYRALASGDLTLQVFPTAMLLNSSQAIRGSNQCADASSPCAR